MDSNSNSDSDSDSDSTIILDGTFRMLPQRTLNLLPCCSTFCPSPSASEEDKVRFFFAVADAVAVVSEGSEAEEGVRANKR